jgi:hypothetical protein
MKSAIPFVTTIKFHAKKPEISGISLIGLWSQTVLGPTHYAVISYRCSTGHVKFSGVSTVNVLAIAIST